jgi:hypothetical protein
MPISLAPHRSNATSGLLIALVLTACGTGSVKSVEAAAAQQVGVQISPTSASLQTAGQTVFAAAVTGTADTAVTWSIREGAGGGVVDATGFYTAPTSAGTYHVVATSAVDPTQSATATVTVTATPPSVISVTISPSSAATSGCQTATFSASVTGSTNQGVTWSVLEGSAGGAVTAGGVYTAPRAAGTYHVVATSAADGSRSSTVAVTVTTKILSLALAPATVSLTAGTTRQLSATVTTTCGTFAAN